MFTSINISKAIDKEIENIYKECFSDYTGGNPLRYNIRKRNDSVYIIDFEIPAGFSTDDLEVSIEKNKLFIHDIQNESQKEDGVEIIVKQFDIRPPFSCEISFSGDIEQTKGEECRFENGVLTVYVNEKKPETKKNILKIC